MALMAVHGEIQPLPDCAIFADTQSEPKQVYDWLNYLEEILPFPVYRVTQGDLSAKIGKKPNGRFDYMPLPAFVQGGDGRAALLNRSCTRDFKIDPIRRKVRELIGLTRRRSPKEPIVVQWIGISADEVQRARPSREPWVQHRWPLLELRRTRAHCLEWMEAHGYPKPPKWPRKRRDCQPGRPSPGVRGDVRSMNRTTMGKRVFDAYAGAGVMWGAVWSKAEGYEGCDVRYFPDERLAFVCDCIRLMRNIDLQPFSIFDFDSYGSPWDNVIVLAARRRVRKGERIGVVLTEGSGLHLKFGSLPNSLAALAGMTAKLSGVSRGGREIATRAINAMARRMNCRIEKTWLAERPQGAAMLYFGVVMVGF